MVCKCLNFHWNEVAVSSSDPAHFCSKIQGQLKGTGSVRKKLPFFSSFQSPPHYFKGTNPQLCPGEWDLMCSSWAPSRQHRAVMHGARLMGLGTAFGSKLEMLVGTRCCLPFQGWKRAMEGAYGLNFFIIVPHLANHCHPSTATAFSELDRKPLIWAWGSARAKAFCRLHRSQNMWFSMGWHCPELPNSGTNGWGADTVTCEFRQAQSDLFGHKGAALLCLSRLLVPSITLLSHLSSGKMFTNCWILLTCFLAVPSFPEQQRLDQVLWCRLHSLASSDGFARAQQPPKSPWVMNVKRRACHAEQIRKPCNLQGAWGGQVALGLQKHTQEKSQLRKLLPTSKEQKLL